MSTRTIAYLRVSTDKQADRGVSLDAQRAKVNTYAELYDLDLAEVIVSVPVQVKRIGRLGPRRHSNLISVRLAAKVGNPISSPKPPATSAMIPMVRRELA